MPSSQHSGSLPALSGLASSLTEILMVPSGQHSQPFSGQQPDGALVAHPGEAADGAVFAVGVWQPDDIPFVGRAARQPGGI